MKAPEEKLLIDGPAGKIEVIMERPDAPKGIALIAHPHPLGGGANTNKVAYTLARCFVSLGYAAFRPNFRGVGGTEGVHDEGRGETDDLLAVIEDAKCRCGNIPVALAGFSFGAFVTSQALQRLLAQAVPREPERLVLVGTAVSRFEVIPVPAALHARTCVIHGEVDDVVPLADVMDWARPQTLPVTVVPGVGHFFHGQLPVLKQLVMRHLLAPVA
jgi:alpha/beta superfamily hydrolase